MQSVKKLCVMAGLAFVFTAVAPSTASLMSAKGVSFPAAVEAKVDKEAKKAEKAAEKAEKKAEKAAEKAAKKQAKADKKAGKKGSTVAPEINASAGVGGLAFVAGALALALDRRRRRADG